MGLMATSSTAAYCLFKTFHVRSIEIWTCQIPTAGSPLATCAVAFPTSGGTFESYKEFSDSSLSDAYPAHLIAKPPANSYSSMWTIDTTNPFMQITGTINSIVDIVVDGVLTDGVGGTSFTVISASAGYVYYAPLDGIGGVIAPVSRTSP